jgi:hypothetical protein
VIVILGFYFRFTGISTNHSLWGDEAEIMSDARDLAYGKDSILNVIKRPGTNYQSANMLVQAASIKLFGGNEFYLRLPYIIAGTLGIIAVFFATLSLSNIYGGLIAAFLFAFSQLNLANHTQAKPYTFIQVLFLFQIYLLIKLHKKNDWKIHELIILISSFAVLFHTLGILIWIPYFIYILSNKNLYTNKKLIAGVLLVFGILAFTFRDIIGVLFINNIFAKNDLVYLKQLLINKYGLILLPALGGIYFSYKKYKALTVGLFIYTLMVLYFVFLKQYTHNLRYLVPFFGVLFMFYGIFWGWVGEKLKRNFVILIFSILILFISKQLVLIPQNYYSPNKDFYGDVQNADYKTMFLEIKKKFPKYQKLVIFNDWTDPQRWYLGDYPTVFFMKGSKGEPHIKTPNKRIYGDLKHFLDEKQKYSQGLLVVEDWESILPEDIKQYAKKNMKLELRVECISVAKDNGHCGDVSSNGNNTEPVLTSNARTNDTNENNNSSNDGDSDSNDNTDNIDRWPLELYSWGL